MRIFIIIPCLLLSIALAAGFASLYRLSNPGYFPKVKVQSHIGNKFSSSSKIELPTFKIKKSWLTEQGQVITAQAKNLNPTVLKLSLNAYLNARAKGLDKQQVLTVVDYSKPSSERRLWVIDLKNSKVLFNTWVTHGKNSGAAKATSFSNRVNSLKSSLGVFVTAESYNGHLGYALRIKGLEKGVNDNAYNRAIVFHGAAYASPEVAKARGMLGRSWGCLAVNFDKIKPLVNTIKNNTVVVAYYPDKSWLKNSSYLAPIQGNTLVI